MIPSELKLFRIYDNYYVGPKFRADFEKFKKHTRRQTEVDYGDKGMNNVSKRLLNCRGILSWPDTLLAKCLHSVVQFVDR